MSIGFELDPCAKCEEVMQPFLDRILDDAERAEAERHLDRCGYCARRYRFEESLRRFVRHAAVEPMSPELKERLSALRIAL
jgi:anti-sigma factor RsiW